MAELDVQPKKTRSFIPWLLLGLGVIALIVYLIGRSDNMANTSATNTNTSTSTTSHSASANINNESDSIDFNTAVASYDEITDAGITIRGKNDYAIYSLSESVLFDEGKSTLRSDASKNLQQISNSIAKRFTNGQINIYEYTDATGNAAANKQLAKLRAEAVRNWLIKNGNIAADRLFVHPISETQSVKTNNTNKSHQPNRRVDIIAKRT